MGNEIDEQNVRIKRLGDKTTALDTRVFNSECSLLPGLDLVLMCLLRAGTQRLDRIK
jgi:hypothetical protein